MITHMTAEYWKPVCKKLKRIERECMETGPVVDDNPETTTDDSSCLLTLHNPNFKSIPLFPWTFLILILFLRNWTSYCMLFPYVLYIVTCGKVNTRLVKITEIKFDASFWGHAGSIGPVTVVTRPSAWNVSARSNTGIVDSNPSRGMDVCPRFFFRGLVVLFR
jgi:hypothetical protein